MKSSRKLKGYRIWLSLFCLIAVLGALVFSGCEPAARLTVENHFSTQVTIRWEATFKSRPPNETYMGTVPAGETRQLEQGFLINPGDTGDIIKLTATDPSDKVVWQKTWTYEEFIKLEEVGWKIVVGPETSQ